MGFWGRLFGSTPATSSPEANTPRDRSADPDWRAFFAASPLKPEVHGPLTAFVGPWPHQIRPDILPPHLWPSVIQGIHEHITSPHPIKTLRALPDPPKPDYRIVDGKVGRASSLPIDMILCQVLPRGSPKSGEPHVIVWNLIQKYAEWPLARLVFHLPRFYAASESTGGEKNVLLVIEDLAIQVYKGVENTLYGLYDGLPEGGRLSDKLVEQKLISFLTAR